ncbi:oligopeptide/dipeptide ABC transporter ATP-binding protein [Terrarubrum flagellatum]|uniref:ABC transporter ATP-binding protein n=1 Tax=Terrirubrum flagellatum TaxID=2895980 RepID=UPI0031456B66
MSAALVRAEGLTKTFERAGRHAFGGGRETLKAVDNISIEIGRRETVALVGESGCGKSTTGRLLLRLLEPTAGKVFYDNVDLTALSPARMREMRRHVQMVFQDPFGSLSPRRTVADIIAEPLDSFGLARSRRERRDRVADLLTQVGLRPAHMDRYPRQFSGGQRQRIGIARAIALDPSFIVADEPVSSLDVSVQAQIVNLLQDLQEQKGLSYLFVAHDLAIVRHIADRVVVMYLGRIMESGPKAQIYGAPHHPYTQALLSAAPEPDPDRKETRIILSGDAPSPSQAITGCSFHTRCPIARDVCRNEHPPLASLGGGHQAACHFAKPFPIPAPAAAEPAGA